MSWRRYPIDSMWREMEEMRAEMDHLFSQVPGNQRLLSGGDETRMISSFGGGFRVDVSDHEDELIIVADLPGIEKENVSLQLLNPRALEITCERKEESENKAKGYFVRERSYGTMQRVVMLPADASEAGSKASFKNGVLEVHLKKAKADAVTRIIIE
jgi:HSP20 family protein